MLDLLESFLTKAERPFMLLVAVYGIVALASISALVGWHLAITLFRLLVS